MKKKLLLVDDDRVISEFIRQGLAQDFVVTVTDDVDFALRSVMMNPPDVLLLDIFLKNANGIELCKKIRENPATKKLPIFIFTGSADDKVMLSSYEVGADDFFSKPFDLDTLRARIFARVKRLRELSNESADFGNLKVYPERNEINVDGQSKHLSGIEFDLLRIFLNNPNQRISREEILETIWSDSKVSERTVDVHISSLRRKLKGFSFMIKSLYGTGYILRPVDKD